MVLNSHLFSSTAKKVEKRERNAIVTLVMDSSFGFVAGALALAQSLIDVESQLPKVVMVTSAVDKTTRKLLKHKFDEIVEVDVIDCIFKTSRIADAMFDMKGEKWALSMNNWRATCTKLAVWSLTKYSRVIFMDADMIAIGNVDDALYKYSNRTFLAAPEILPPDTINSGFMVLEPSKKMFDHLMGINNDMGVAWTGDQYIINYGFCPKWHSGTFQM